MSRINRIQTAIKELDGGSFQKLMDAYLYKKYRFDNIQTLGVQEGTNKTTKGTPDSYVLGQDGQYILLMHGSKQRGACQKIKQDILSCFEKSKLELEESRIKKIICTHTSTNIRIEQLEELRGLIPGIELEIIGLDTISHDLLLHFRDLATDFLNIPMDTHQIFSIDNFIKEYDKNGMSAPLNMPLHFRATEAKEIYESISAHQITLVTGESGVGKTRLVLEVCRQFAAEGLRVFCIKSNGAELYEDMQTHLSDGGNYVLFIDDANQATQLKYVLDYIVTLSETMVARIVMTVRDYAKQRVWNLVCQYKTPQEIAIDTLSNDEIKVILNDNFGIINENYLDRIAQIAKGNVRLAVLAGKISIDQGCSALINAENIFAQYYRNIMNDAKLTTTDVGVLFVVSFFGPFRYKDNQVAQTMLGAMNISPESFLASCQELQNIELIDLYLDEVAKISDQSFGNYILEYVLIEKKMLLVSQLLSIAFPQYTNKVVYAINTIQKLFYSKELEKYLKEQINISWEQAKEDQDAAYLETFYAFNEEKSLAKLAEIINGIESGEMDVMSFDIEKHKNFNNISQKEIVVLSKFKYSKYFEDAIELMLRLYGKRPDFVMDFYFAFSDRMSLDSRSHQYDYEFEYRMVKCLWEHTHGGEDVYITELLIHILPQMLKCQFCETGLAEDGRGYTIRQCQVLFTEGSKKLRYLIWEILSILYCNAIYRGYVENIISDNYVGRLDESKAKEFCQFDIQCIQELFFDKWERLSFEQCKILRELENHAKWRGIENEALFHRYITNDDFMIYNTLTRKRAAGQTQEKYEAEYKHQILEMVSTYTEDDYKKLFQVCQNCERNKDEEGWLLVTGLDIIFEAAEDDPEQYYNLADLYLQAKVPYSHNADKVISFLLKNFGFEETKKLIEEKDFSYKHKWMSAFWKMIPEEMLNLERTKEFLGFIKCEAALSEPELPEVGCLLRYRTYDPDIVRKVSEMVLENSQENVLYIAKFLGFAFSDDVIEVIMSLYVNDLQLLERLYYLASGANSVAFDHTGKLLGELVDNNKDFWDEYTKNLCGNMKRLSSEYAVFNYIWSLDTYDELIDIAYRNMLSDCFSFMVEEEAKAIFASSEELSEFIVHRKKEWVREYIKDNLENENNLKMIFSIIASFFKDDKKEFMLELLNYREDIEVFRMIPFFENFETWSGSEVPLIEEKIDFLNELMSSLQGVDFIAHRAYLKEMINGFESHKQEILLREYLENADIA